MNASRLKEVVDFLLQLESNHAIQKNLNETLQNLNYLVQQPQNSQYQTQFSNSLEKLRSSVAEVREKLAPAQIILLNEIGANDYFVEDFTAQIIDWMQKNPLTPAVTQKNVTDFRGKREQYINTLTNLRDSLRTIGIEANGLKPGEAEIGILLPRPLFDNKFERLIKELQSLNFIFRPFSEISTGGVEEIEVRQISTTDPLFFLGMSPTTIALLAGAVTWALNTWKQVEDIRKVRAETSRLTVFTPQEVSKIFEEKIKKTIDDAVEEKAEALLEHLKSEAGRQKEIRTHLTKALHSILAHIEWGMTVEIRLLPPEKTAEQTAEVQQTFNELAETAPKLSFPTIEGAPILELPKTEE